MGGPAARSRRHVAAGAMGVQVPLEFAIGLAVAVKLPWYVTHPPPHTKDVY